MEKLNPSCTQIKNSLKRVKYCFLTQTHHFTISLSYRPWQNRSEKLLLEFGFPEILKENKLGEREERSDLQGITEKKF